MPRDDWVIGDECWRVNLLLLPTTEFRLVTQRMSDANVHGKQWRKSLGDKQTNLTPKVCVEFTPEKCCILNPWTLWSGSWFFISNSGVLLGKEFKLKSVSSNLVNKIGVAENSVPDPSIATSSWFSHCKFSTRVDHQHYSTSHPLCSIMSVVMIYKVQNHLPSSNKFQ